MTRHLENTCKVSGCSNPCWKEVCRPCGRRIRYGALPPQFGIDHNPPCEDPGCGEPKYTKSGRWCRGHYPLRTAGETREKRGKRKNGSAPQPCTTSGCEKPIKYGGKCASCNYREKYVPKRTPCKEKECHSRVNGDYCKTHKAQEEKYGFTWVGDRPIEKIRQIKEGWKAGCVISGCDRKESSLGGGWCRKHLSDKSRKGCTPEFYQRLMERQECETCGETEGLVVDHDHSCHTGDKMCEKCIRGRLCGGCNTALGYAKEDPERLRNLARYIERFQ